MGNGLRERAERNEPCHRGHQPDGIAKILERWREREQDVDPRLFEAGIDAWERS